MFLEVGHVINFFIWFLQAIFNQILNNLLNEHVTLKCFQGHASIMGKILSAHDAFANLFGYLPNQHSQFQHLIDAQLT